VRWEALFDDLAGQWEAARRADDDARIADMAELEMGRVLLADRVRARRGRDLSVRLADGTDVAGLVMDAAPQWLLLGSGERRRVLPMAAIAVAWPLGPVAPEPGAVERRLGITHVLRAIAREGATVRVVTTSGAFRGRLVRVGADHVDVAIEPVAGALADRVSVALAALLFVEST